MSKNERRVGTVSRGIRCPIIRQGDDLAKIRLYERNGDFCGALFKAAEHEEKCRLFVEEITEFRQLAADMPESESANM